MNDNYEQLRSKLKEIFQMDQADLDFGIYCVMNTKREEIVRYLDEQLRPQVKEILSSLALGNTAEIEKRMKEIEQQAKRFKADPEDDPEYQDLVRCKAGNLDIDALEKEIFSDLFNFFSRYYEEGDFLSLRRYKADVYAIPYEGEEVKLHWANHDQYYIKTSEYFTNYSFSLPESEKRVHFRLIKAETEQDNNKERRGKERRFMLSHEKPLFFDNKDLVIGIEYVADSERRNQKKINQSIIETLRTDSRLADFDELFSIENVNGKEVVVLERHLKSYTVRNTFDYFIHKDLGGFLRRELDFFLKNEVLALDDIVDQRPKDFEKRLAKLKALKQTGHKIILFLAQLENFQKKLWLKKKLVVETNWCITLDRVPEEFYAEIATNKAQREEWLRLFAIDEIKASNGDLPLSEDFLKGNPYLVLDTVFFSERFKQRLVATIDNLDEQTDGLLIYSENFQALNLLQEKYRESVKCIYIDPPYNSPSSEIIYKNSYKHSSWLSLISDRLSISSTLQTKDGTLIVAIDKHEQENLGALLNETHPEHVKTCITVQHNKKGTQGSFFSYNHEYAYFVIPESLKKLNERSVPQDQWEYGNLRNWGKESLRTDAKNCFYPIYVKDGEVHSVGDVCAEDFHPDSQNVTQSDGGIAVYPIDKEGVERKWRYAKDSIEKIFHTLRADVGKKGNYEIKMPKLNDKFKTIWDKNEYIAGDFGTKVLTDMGFPSTAFDFPKSIFTVEDSIYSVSDPDSYILDYFSGSGTTGHAVINMNREDSGSRKYILVEMGEYFTTLTKPRIQKAIYSRKWLNGKPQKLENLLRELKKSLKNKKKEIRNLKGVDDQEEYDFQKQFISGEIYSLESQIDEVQELCDKGINNFGGSSHCFKTIRLESYEDTLNNLILNSNKLSGNKLLQDNNTREQYMLSYMLDVESKDSLLDLEMFDKPFDYKLSVNRRNEVRKATVDLVETFNYLIGLNVYRQDQVRCFHADFTRDEEDKLIIKDCIRQSDTGSFAYRMLNGKTRGGEETLVIWRQMTGNLEEDNVALDEYFRAQVETHIGVWCPDVIYVNGDNNLLSIREDEEKWEIRLIEEAFHRLMFTNEGV